MTDETTEMAWNGRPIKELSREELIQGIKHLAERARQTRETAEKLAEACSLARSACSTRRQP